MRWYLPNIARFPSVDPLTAEYPWYTPYQFAGNMPICAVDLDGAEPWFNPTTGKNQPPVIKTVKEKTVLESYMPYVVGQNNLVSPNNNVFQEPIGDDIKGTYPGAFGTHAAALIHRAAIVNRHARDSKRTKYGTLDDKSYVAYDCITTFIAVLELIEPGNYRKYNTKKVGGDMGQFMTALNTAGLAGEIIKATVDPAKKAFKGTSLSEGIKKSILGKKGSHIFGLSINGGYHSATLVVNNRNVDGTEAGTTITFQLYDQSKWNGEILTAEQLDKKLAEYSAGQKSSEDGVVAREIFKPETKTQPSESKKTKKRR